MYMETRSTGVSRSLSQVVVKTPVGATAAISDRPSPLFKGAAETPDLLPEQVQVFFFFYAVFFQSVAVREDIPDHDVDKGSAFHAYRVRPGLFRTRNLLRDQYGIRQ